MRVNVRKALAAFAAHKPAGVAQSIWTDGETLWSYATPLAVHVSGGIILNVTGYSQTTTTQQNAIRCAAPATYGLAIVGTVCDVPRGARPDYLREAMSR